MLFVLPALVFWGLVALAVWYFFFRQTASHEQTVANALRREARFNELLQTENEPLHCLGCQISFLGPLNEHGCPQCHTRALVLPVQTSDDPAVRQTPLWIEKSASPVAETAEPTMVVGQRNHL